MAEKAISLPLSLDPYGRIAQTESQSKIWSDRVLSVIGTNLKERLMLGSFGTNITSYLYDSYTRAVVAIPTEVEKAFSGFLPTLTYVDTTITEDDTTGTLLVDITYQLPNEDTQKTVVALVAVAGKNPPVQENL